MGLESLRCLAYPLAFGLALGCSSCGIGVSYKPKGRLGCTPALNFRRNFSNPNKLGKHCSTEKNGLLYSCDGGFIDVAHLRKSADWTRILSERTYDSIMAGEKKFNFKLIEQSVYNVRLDYPDGWNNLSYNERRGIAKNVSIDLGEYFSFVATTWHEMLTWFGWRSVFFVPDFISSFTVDDQFSNFLGSYLASRALRKEGDFNEDLTRILNEELVKLKVQPRSVASKAEKTLTGRIRHFDVGEDGYMNPFVVSVGECENGDVISYQVPDGDVSEHGFSMGLEIDARCSAGDKMLRVVDKKMIEPKTDFAPIMEYVKRQAREKYGFEVHP
jgi:hypothetical protein